MSSWTHIHGIILVEPNGQGQRAKDFILGEVVDHLPKVTGSEEDMFVEIIRRQGYNSWCNHDEFGRASNLHDHYGNYGTKVQSQYELVLYGNFRDRYFDETLKEFVKWLNRLSKRVHIYDILVKLYDDYGKSYLFDSAFPWSKNFDRWSWIPEDYDYKLRPEHYYMSSCRRSTNFRYNIFPHGEGNWIENLINLIPSGHKLAYESDVIGGQLEPYEYNIDDLELIVDIMDEARNVSDELVDLLEDMNEVESI